MILSIVFATEILTFIWHNLNFDIWNNWGWKNALVKSTSWYHTLIKWLGCQTPNLKQSYMNIYMNNQNIKTDKMIFIPFTLHKWLCMKYQFPLECCLPVTPTDTWLRNKRVRITNKIWHQPKTKESEQQTKHDIGWSIFFRWSVASALVVSIVRRGHRMGGFYTFFSIKWWTPY